MRQKKPHPHSKNERTMLAGRNDPNYPPGYNKKGVRTFYPRKYRLHCAFQVTVVYLLQKMGDHASVGLRSEYMPRGRQVPVSELNSSR